jgi:hypothetical protein
MYDMVASYSKNAMDKINSFVRKTPDVASILIPSPL